ncbi:tetratricopeptide repeat protein [Paractinoplanes lichenicola]|uniref:Tetratricopeptide repeat protein n=1 Tax=Paractinoplanes lichenicola TaxID=2802976 RepID=A0ABS1VQA6_9ACTN|nr:tetratricopeptide repeat protein [Actinoplanes lichenicola]MBL7255942.1 tetratricopeptide repeat protein [Actinoplanes lichenicola]
MSQPSPLGPARQRAHALASSGDLAGARALLEQAVELGKVNLSEDDPDVLRTAYELGILLQRADDPSAARRVLEDAYAAGQWRLGDSDSLMVLISHEIGVAAEELGNRHEARKAFTRVAEWGPAVLGGDHPAVAKARAYLGPDQEPSPVRAESEPPQAGSPGLRFSGAAQQQQAPRFNGTPPQPQAPAFNSAAPQPQTPTFNTPQPQPQAPTFNAPAPQPQAPTFNAPPPPQAPSFSARPAQQEAGPAQQEAPTTVFEAVPPQVRPRTVQPPTEANQQVWTEPATQPGPLPHQGPVDEPTMFQPQVPQAAPWGGAPQQPQYPAAAPTSGQVFAPAHQSGPTPYGEKGRKGLGVFAAIAAVMAAVIAVAALVFVLANRTSDPSDRQDVPTLAGQAPTEVTLSDKGTTIEVRWADPTEGTVPFMVIMGRPGQELKPAGTLVPGRTSFEMEGLNTNLNYCFAVVAVYSGNKFATSPQACTSRAAATPR